MVSKKSIFYGQFDGFQSSFVPKAPRSLRRNSHKKSSEGSKLCAFELLAAVADKLLQESESSTSSIGQEKKENTTFPYVKQEEPEVKVKFKHVKSDHVDQGSCAESESNLKLKLNSPLKESLESDNDSGLEHVSDVEIFKKVGNNVKLEPSDGKIVDKLEGNAHSQGELCEFNLVNRVLSKSVSSVKLPFYKNPISCFTKHRGNVKTGITDDDDNLFRYNHRGAHMRAFRSQSNVGYRRIRKMLTSRYRKVSQMKDYELTNPTSAVMPFYQNRKNVYKRKIGQIEAASKRRKLFHHNSSKNSYIQEERNESISKLHEKSGNGDKTSNKVKFSIQSFKVPEIYVEIPETETIGSLKRTVMEAVRTFLGGKLHVGIHLDGKKVKDNNRTLKQTGISQNFDLENLGFALEPSSCTASPITDVGISKCSLDQHPETSLDKCLDKNQEIIVPLENEVLTEEKVADIKDLVPAVTVNHKLTKKFELPRRIRRPFSIEEVEALVEAVESLGTGRWRDVKLRAFDDANHRTYVDLKDKWKTLVHTASILPQQRRGEPVPQDLLDRVLAAHGYWSNHQVKRSNHQVKQCKHQTEPLGILGGSSVEFVGI